MDIVAQLTAKGLSQKQAENCFVDFFAVVFSAISLKLKPRLTKDDHETLHKHLKEGNGTEFYTLLRSKCNETEWAEIEQNTILPLLQSYTREVVNG